MVNVIQMLSPMELLNACPYAMHLTSFQTYWTKLSIGFGVLPAENVTKSAENAPQRGGKGTPRTVIGFVITPKYINESTETVWRTT